MCRKTRDASVEEGAYRDTARNAKSCTACLPVPVFLLINILPSRTCGTRSRNVRSCEPLCERSNTSSCSEEGLRPWGVSQRSMVQCEGTYSSDAGTKDARTERVSPSDHMDSDMQCRCSQPRRVLSTVPAMSEGPCLRHSDFRTHERAMVDQATTRVILQRSYPLPSPIFLYLLYHIGHILCRSISNRIAGNRRRCSIPKHFSPASRARLAHSRRISTLEGQNARCPNHLSCHQPQHATYNTGVSYSTEGSMADIGSHVVGIKQK